MPQGQGEGAGAAGTVVVEAPQVILTGGAHIGSATFGLGQGGRVTVRATEIVSLEGTTPSGSRPVVFLPMPIGQGERGR